MDDNEWAEVVEEAANEAEEVCAARRWQARQLNQTNFQTLGDKAEALKQLRARGVSREAAHKQTDAVIRRLRNICLLHVDQHHRDPEQANDPSYQRRARMVRVQQAVAALQKAQMRLEMAYRTLEEALQLAELPLPSNVVDGWRMHVSDAEADVRCCAICLSEIELKEGAGGEGRGDEAGDGDDDESGLLLPCGHAFHVGCGRQWLHKNASCPNCRLDLSEHGRAAAGEGSA